MKCIKNENGVITREFDFVADEKVSTGKYKYCSKSSWKKEVRDKK